MIDWSRLIGQNQAVELLQRALQINSIAPAYLFAGAKGIGRTFAAKCFCQDLLTSEQTPEERELILKRFLAGNHPDLLWIEPTYQHQGKLLTAKEAQESNLKRKAPPQIRIEQIREITNFLSRPPLESARSVVVIEEAHTMTEAAANALLKTLEEPGKATLILIAPSSSSLLPTLVSRCQHIPFQRLSEENLAQVLRSNGHARILDYPAIIGLAQGSAGEAIAALEFLDSLPQDLPRSLTKFSRKLSQALELGKITAQTLDTETQLWYVSYLQYEDWQQRRDRSTLDILEKTRRHLLAYAQPRLVWECTFLELAKLFTAQKS
jgi:DNA polymerase-3 subunit delta'